MTERAKSNRPKLEPLPFAKKRSVSLPVPPRVLDGTSLLGAPTLAPEDLPPSSSFFKPAPITVADEPHPLAHHHLLAIPGAETLMDDETIPGDEFVSDSSFNIEASRPSVDWIGEEPSPVPEPLEIPAPEPVWERLEPVTLEIASSGESVSQCDATWTGCTEPQKTEGRKGGMFPVNLEFSVERTCEQVLCDLSWYDALPKETDVSTEPKSETPEPFREESGEKPVLPAPKIVNLNQDTSDHRERITDLIKKIGLRLSRRRSNGTAKVGESRRTGWGNHVNIYAKVNNTHGAADPVACPCHGEETPSPSFAEPPKEHAAIFPRERLFTESEELPVTIKIPKMTLPVPVQSKPESLTSLRRVVASFQEESETAESPHRTPMYNQADPPPSPVTVEQFSPSMKHSFRPVQMSVTSLHKRYLMGKIDIPVLKGVELEIRQGEMLSIVGQSGSGKSTLLHLMATLDVPDSGVIEFEGQRIDNLPASHRDVLRNRFIGMIFQFYHLLPELTTLENVLMPLMIRESVFGYLFRKRRYVEQATALLERVGLKHRLKHRPGELSGGEMQRVSIARALVTSPKILMADEPTGNLDAESAQGILELLRLLNTERELTIVMVTHDLSIARQADRLIRLVDGRVVPEDEFRAC